ncbi:serine hydrolase domain-containing protein [Paracnuella aquatica]|uniref:serine hydrolase domain-containing protein n=1 Tax=Paracnuella aquatica TaxID=2268757 RepID=UPI000DEF25E9|nr:serine hydrolase domain-containing protein [Paracnuella aquatica]RPD47286.1 class A beta-lactamase-related serine hydrolase [Paracnuella aquatica]
MKPAIALLLPLLIAEFAQPAIAQSQQKTVVDATAKSRIDAALKSFVDSGQIAGVSALVYEKGKEVYFNAFGYADAATKRPMDRNTITRIYSMTKPITGVALMQLYEKGLFQLDDPLSKYAPEFANMQVYKGTDASGNIILEPAKRPITIRDITRHTAGFAPGIDHPVLNPLVAKADVFNPNNTLTEMAKRLASLPLLFHPGDQWGYGASVDVQAYLVEKLSGKPFDQYLAANIFKPLGMNNTGYVLAPADRNRFAALYQRDATGKASAISMGDNEFNIKDRALKPGGFGLISTVDDYMKFARMLLNKGKFNNATILKPQTVQLMATSHLSDTVSQRMWLPSKGQVGFGIDFAVRTRPPASAAENNGVVGEFFWDGAASTLFWVDPVNELTAVLFVQVMPFYGGLHKAFRDAVYGPYKQQ